MQEIITLANERLLQTLSRLDQLVRMYELEDEPAIRMQHGILSCNINLQRQSFVVGVTWGFSIQTDGLKTFFGVDFPEEADESWFELDYDGELWHYQSRGLHHIVDKCPMDKLTMKDHGEMLQNDEALHLIRTILAWIFTRM